MNAFSKFKAQNNEIHILWNIAYPRWLNTAQNKTAYFAKQNSGFSELQGRHCRPKTSNLLMKNKTAYFAKQNSGFSELQGRHCRLKTSNNKEQFFRQ
ncbi:MAG: hypothetical protein IJM59_11175 [Proteobacteria bacterium]|nr:hypothetical protein [Pseudomonadota bacterium]